MASVLIYLSSSKLEHCSLSLCLSVSVSLSLSLALHLAFFLYPFHFHLDASHCTTHIFPFLLAALVMGDWGGATQGGPSPPPYSAGDFGENNFVRYHAPRSHMPSPSEIPWHQDQADHTFRFGNVSHDDQHDQHRDHDNWLSTDMDSNAIFLEAALREQNNAPLARGREARDARGFLPLTGGRTRNEDLGQKYAESSFGFGRF